MNGMTYIPLIQKLPPEYRKVLEFKEITNAEDVVITFLREEIQKVLDRQFPEDSDEIGISRYEKIYGITPKDTDTLENRRSRILTRFKSQLPYTMRRLHELMTETFGAGQYTLDLDADNYLLTVDADVGQNATTYEEVERIVEKMRPANMLVLYIFKYYRIAQVQALTLEQVEESTIEKFSGGD